MAYPFVQAKNDYGISPVSKRAILIHMAEGGGTVQWLSTKGDVDDGNSSHYVIEYTGRVVQMLLESHTAGSIKIKFDSGASAIRTDNDTDGFYGVTVAKAVLGPLWSDPNDAIFSIEMEGFAANGPNAVQQSVLQKLVSDISSRHSSIIGNLGHRDLQNYKACPGHKIPWDRIGGHGVYTVDMIPKPITDITPKLVDVLAGAVWYNLDETPASSGHGALTSFYSPYGVDTFRAILVGVSAGKWQTVLVKPSKVVDIPKPILDCTAEIAADRLKAHIVEHPPTIEYN